MNKALVTVATNRYIHSGMRLSEKFREFEPEVSQFHWFGAVPQGCPEHRSRPYAFKAYALEFAREAGADIVLWCDSQVLPVKPLGRLWDRIEKDGYWIAANGWANYDWTTWTAYQHLFPGFCVRDAMEQNKKITHVLATSFGLNLRSEIGAKFLLEYYRLASTTDAFCGPWGNSRNPKAPQYGVGGEYTMGDCGMDDILGHRHDQTAASVIAWKLGMKLSACPDIIAYNQKDPRTLMLLNGDVNG